MITPKELVRRANRLRKNLTFWSILLGWVMGYFLQTGETLAEQVALNVSGAINFENPSYLKFTFLFVAVVIFAMLFILVERKASEQEEKRQQENNEVLSKLTKQLERLNDRIGGEDL